MEREGYEGVAHSNYLTKSVVVDRKTIEHLPSELDIGEIVRDNGSDVSKIVEETQRRFRIDDSGMIDC